MSEINEDDKKSINGLALLFYKMHGNVVPMDYDFSEAGHPQERNMWNMSCVAHAVLNNNTEFMEYQT